MTTEQSTDRLFDGDCCALCGATTYFPGSAHALNRGFAGNPDVLWCSACSRVFGTQSQRSMNDEYRRRKSLAASRPAEFYMTQPSELPATLPAGILWERPGPYPRSRTNVSYTLTPNWRSDGFSYQGIHVNWIDWTTVPIQPPPETSRAVCRACSGARHVTYCETCGTGAPPPPDVAKDPRDSLPPRRERTGVLLDPYRNGMAPEYVGRVGPPEDEKRRAERVAAMSVSTNPLDRLASKRAQLFADMSRPSPRTWRNKMGAEVTWTSWARTEWGGRK